jgi:hypothetical protein
MQGVLSLLYRSIRSLLGFLAVIAHSDVSKDVELFVLRQGNQVLRRQVRGRPPDRSRAVIGCGQW